jgi:hypothetical protein
MSASDVALTRKVLRMFLLLLLGLVFFLIAPGLAAMILGPLAEREQKVAARARAALDAKDVCDGLFTGLTPTVIYEVTPSTLPFELVVAGAVERGYHLEARDKGKLVFARTIATTD